MNEYYEHLNNVMDQLYQNQENVIIEAVFNYANPVMKIKGEITKEKIGKKLQWRGIKTIIVRDGSKKLSFVVQRNIIISRFIIDDYPHIYISDIKHPFFGIDWRKDNFILIKRYMGMK